MPTLDHTMEADAPPEDVWKLIHDPEAFLRWWGCLEAGPIPKTTTHPRFPLAQVVGSSRADGRIVVSCAMDDITFDWQLEEREAGGTRINLHVDVPDHYGFALEPQRQLIEHSMNRLARLAEEGVPAASA